MAVDSKKSLLLLMLCIISSISGCATTAVTTVDPTPVRSEADPWEPMNRGIYHMNRAFDNATLKPIAKGYRAVLPSPVRRGITNFSLNLFTPRSAISNFLQGKFRRGFDDIARFAFNTTLGIGGIFDVASAGGLEQYNETFSQVLAVWGVPEGPYVVIPFLGPQSLLDAVMIPVDIRADPMKYYDNASVRDRLYILRLIDLRARLLNAEQFLEDSQDPYVTLRESYLQNRQYNIHDGNPPVDDDLYDDIFDEE